MRTTHPPTPPRTNPPVGILPASSRNDKKKRRHILGLPPGYEFDPNAKPTLEDLSGIPACFGDDPLRPGQSRTESDGLSAG